MKNQLFLYLTIFLGIGIIISDHITMGTNLRIYLILLFFSLFISLLISNQPLRFTSICLQFTLIGLLLGYNTKRLNFNFDHIPLKNKVSTLKVLENYTPTEKYQKFKVYHLTTEQIGLLHLPISEKTIYPSDTIIVYGNSYPLSPTLNPYQFDYKEFLNRKNMTYTIYGQSILKIKNNHHHWKKWIITSKENIRARLKEEGYTQETRSIISSMLLGDRTEITEEINNNYIATGVIHILSISGLHVVMIYVILQFILQPLLLLRNGRNIRILVSLIAIWLFAFYVELQPPVFRSALMISIYYLSELLKRPKNIYHTLSLSAFIILVFQPNYIFDVGFQLSFSAIFFIVWLNPIYKQLYQPKHKITRYFYDLSSTSISAQLGTMPFTTLYFNQFSALFLFGNIILIPASFFMIIGAIIAIILSFLRFNFSIYIRVFNWFISTCNHYLNWLSTFDTVVFKQVYISGFTACLLFIILLLVHPLLIQRSKLALLGFLSCFVLIQLDRVIDINTIKTTNEFIVFHDYKTSLIGIRNGQKAYFFSSKSIDSIKAKTYTIRPYLIRNRIKESYYYPMDTILNHPLFIKRKHLLIVNNTSFFIGENLAGIPKNLDYLLIRNSSFHPADLSNLNQIKRVIADGSNYPNYVSEIDSILKNKSNSILWKTSEKGYFKIKF